MNIISSFDEFLLQNETRKKRTHNPSDLTACLRQLYYKWNGVEKSNPPTAGNIIKMQFGNLAEELLVPWLDNEVHKGRIQGYEQQVEVWSNEPDLEVQLHGYQDFVLTRPDGTKVGLECKSSFGQGIKYIQSTGKPKPEHLVQCYAYMKYGEPKEYWLFYIGRDNGYRTCFYLTYNETREAITFDDLADFYHKKTGGTARTKPMDSVVEWATKQEEIEYDDANDCYYFNDSKKNGLMTCEGQPVNIDWDYYIGRMQLSESTIGGELPPEREFKAAIKEGNPKYRYQRNNVTYSSDYQCMYCDWLNHCWKPLIEDSKNGTMYYGDEVVE
jgi:hypothetical protein